MNTKSMVTVVLSAIIAVVVCVAVLIPAVSDAQVNAGDKVEQTNAGTIAYTSSDEISMTFVLSGDYTVNGTVYELPAYNYLIVSEQCSVNIAANTGECGIIDYVSHNKEWVTTGTITYTLSGGTYTLVTPTHTYTGIATSALYYSGTEGDYLQGTAFHVNKMQGGFIKVGGNFWNTQQGIAKVSDYRSGATNIDILYYGDDFAYVSTATKSITWEVIESDNGVFDVSDFTPETGVQTEALLMFAPSEYFTYEPNSETSLITIIPLLVIVGIVLGVIGSFIAKRD